MKCIGLRSVRTPNHGEIVAGKECELPNSLAKRLIAQGVVEELKQDVPKALTQELNDDRI
jgi:hypothetical protein